jgi:hypothetical protein
VEVRWQGTGSDIVTHYLIYRRASDLHAWDTIDQVPARGDNQESYVYQVRAAEEGTLMQYAVAAVDRYGNRSTLSSAP